MKSHLINANALKFIPVLVVLGLCSCEVRTIDPQQAVMDAAGEDQGVTGKFKLTVQAVGFDQGRMFLNSETDYRDQRNLCIVVLPQQIGVLAAKYREEPDVFLLHKRIVVAGTARKTRITFFADGHPTDKYYFQTHVNLVSPDDLKVVD